MSKNNLAYEGGRMLFSILCFFCFLVEVLGEKHGR